MVDPIKKALDAGIAVMDGDSDSPRVGVSPIWEWNIYEGGLAAADHVGQTMGETGKVRVDGRAWGLQPGGRIRGCKDGVKVDPGIGERDDGSVDDDQQQGRAGVEEVMQAHPDLNGWFFVWLLAVVLRIVGRCRYGKRRRWSGLTTIMFRHGAGGGVCEGRLDPGVGRSEVLGLGLRHGADDDDKLVIGKEYRELHQLGDDLVDGEQRGL